MKNVKARLKTKTLVIFRIMQEAMNNISNHGKRNFVYLRLRKIENKIEEKTIPFDPEILIDLITQAKIRVLDS